MVPGIGAVALSDCVIPNKEEEGLSLEMKSLPPPPATTSSSSVAHRLLAGAQLVVLGAVDWAVEAGIANPARLCVGGWSYLV